MHYCLPGFSLSRDGAIDKVSLVEAWSRGRYQWGSRQVPLPGASWDQDHRAMFMRGPVPTRSRTHATQKHHFLNAVPEHQDLDAEAFRTKAMIPG
jgi:hypothetical protein